MTVVRNDRIKMKLIGITDERTTADEAEQIVSALENGLDLLHIRKPNASVADIDRLISGLPVWSHSKIVLHDGFELCTRYALKGIHVNRRHPDVPDAFTGSVSRSCHSIAELCDYPAYDYLFLSPVCDSVSKAGYSAAYSDDELRNAAETGKINERVVALGGITPDTIERIKRFPFGGVAVLGYLWQGNALSLPERLKRLMEKLK